MYQLRHLSPIESRLNNSVARLNRNGLNLSRNVSLSCFKSGSIAALGAQATKQREELAYIPRSNHDQTTQQHPQNAIIHSAHLAKARIRNLEAWNTVGKSVMRGLFSISSSEISDFIYSCALIGFRHPFLLQGLLEALLWKHYYVPYEPKILIPVLRSLSMLRFRPSPRHFHHFLESKITNIDHWKFNDVLYLLQFLVNFQLENSYYNLFNKSFDIVRRNLGYLNHRELITLAKLIPNLTAELPTTHERSEFFNQICNIFNKRISSIPHNSLMKLTTITIRLKPHPFPLSFIQLLEAYLNLPHCPLKAADIALLLKLQEIFSIRNTRLISQHVEALKRIEHISSIQLRSILQSMRYLHYDDESLPQSLIKKLYLPQGEDKNTTLLLDTNQMAIKIDNPKYLENSNSDNTINIINLDNINFRYQGSLNSNDIVLSIFGYYQHFGFHMKKGILENIITSTTQKVELTLSQLQDTRDFDTLVSPYRHNVHPKTSDLTYTRISHLPDYQIIKEEIVKDKVAVPESNEIKMNKDTPKRNEILLENSIDNFLLHSDQLLALEQLEASLDDSSDKNFSKKSLKSLPKTGITRTEQNSHFRKKSKLVHKVNAFAPKRSIVGKYPEIIGTTQPREDLLKASDLTRSIDQAKRIKRTPISVKTTHLSNLFNSYNSTLKRLKKRMFYSGQRSIENVSRNYQKWSKLRQVFLTPYKILPFGGSLLSCRNNTLIDDGLYVTPKFSLIRSNKLNNEAHMIYKMTRLYYQRDKKVNLNIKNLPQISEFSSMSESDRSHTSNRVESIYKTSLFDNLYLPLKNINTLLSSTTNLSTIHTLFYLLHSYMKSLLNLNNYAYNQFSKLNVGIVSTHYNHIDNRLQILEYFEEYSRILKQYPIDLETCVNYVDLISHTFIKEMLLNTREKLINTSQLFVILENLIYGIEKDHTTRYQLRFTSKIIELANYFNQWEGYTLDISHWIILLKALKQVKQLKHTQNDFIDTCIMNDHQFHSLFMRCFTHLDMNYLESTNNQHISDLITEVSTIKLLDPLDPSIQLIINFLSTLSIPKGIELF